MEPKLEATKPELVTAFAEWWRRWKEDPARFLADSKRLGLADKDYGEGAADYLIDLLGKK